MELSRFVVVCKKKICKVDTLKEAKRAETKLNEEIKSNYPGIKTYAHVYSLIR